MKKSISLILTLVVLAFHPGPARAATWYLNASSSSNDYTDPAIWYSQPFTGGTAATSINSTDSYDLNGYSVVSPKITSGSSTFAGGTLILHGGLGGFLSTKAGPPAILNIPNITSDGGFIQNSAYTGNLTFNVTNFVNNSNTTINGGNSTRGLNITITTLSGSGDICAIGEGGGSAGGTILLNVGTATGFTGTLHIADGCQFTFENAMTSGGALDVDAVTATGTANGTSIALNYMVTFKGLTINGVAKAAGTYTASALGAPFSGSGSVVVQTAATPTLTVNQPYGVNLPGGTFGTPIYPTDPYEWGYYHGKGLNLIRMGFKWEAIQPTLNGTLSSSVLTSLDTAVREASTNGMQVILDMHNYDRYTPSYGTNQYVIGWGTNVTYANYQNAWQQIAAHYATNTAVYGYDIMNEPHGDSVTNNGTVYPSSWDSFTAQYGVNGVRQSDTNHFVIVEGDSNAGAQAWMGANANFSVTDSADHLIYSAHTYWDSNDSGGYSGTYDSNNDYPNVGVDRVAQFVYWLGLTGNKGFVGEFGVPNNVTTNLDYRWNDALDNFLYYLNSNEVEATYWSGGKSWTQNYPLLCATFTSPETFTDAPAMDVLEEYGAMSTPFVTAESLESEGTPSTNDWYGMQINVGANPITVTQLGRWVVSGSTETHTLELVNASTKAVLGSVSVNNSGAPANAFAYATLTTPVILAANTSYYVASKEISGGDKYYYDETTVTPTSVATVPNSIYSADGVTWTSNRTTNHCFVPVSFQYY